MNLADLNPGQSGIIHSLDDSDPFLSRLAELGFVPGEQVSVLRKAPLGDPLELLIRGYRLSLRRSEAKRVALEDDSSN